MSSLIRHAILLFEGIFVDVQQARSTLFFCPPRCINYLYALWPSGGIFRLEMSRQKGGRDV